MTDDPAGIAAPQAAVADGDRIIVLGAITGAFGVQGWVKVRSWTEPPGNILDYETWLLGPEGKWQPVRVEGGRVTGKGVLAKLEGVDTPELARQYSGRDIGVRRSELPQPTTGEYYWSDLEGLEAVGAHGEVLGRIDHFRETPAGAVVVIRGEQEHWIPFVPERIRQVDLDAGRVVFDWATDWS